MRVALGADHGGFLLKNEMLVTLRGAYELKDMGAYHLDPSDDYPDIVLPVAGAVASGEVERGIIIYGSGVGACIAANKMPGIRACLCHDSYSAHQGVEDDDMNVLCLGARMIGVELATELAWSFLKARFSNEARFRRRLEKVLALERRNQGGK